MVSCQISQVDSAEMELLLFLGDTMKTLSDIKYLFPWMFICAFIHPVLMVFSPLLSTPPHLCCATLSEVLSGTLFAFSLHFGDTSVKTHQLFQHRFQCHQAPQLWLCKCKSLTGATDTHISP